MKKSAKLANKFEELQAQLSLHRFKKYHQIHVEFVNVWNDNFAILEKCINEKNLNAYAETIDQCERWYNSNCGHCVDWLEHICELVVKALKKH